MNTLNLGAGTDIHPDAVNVDKRNLPGIQVVQDLDAHPWAIAGQYDTILALDIFEHLEDVPAAMDECWRLLAPDGTLVIRGPTSNSPNLWVDVTHQRAFTPHSFDHFDPETELGRKYHYGSHPWLVLASNSEDGNITFWLRARQ